MGRIRCKVHGLVGFIETCAHVASEIERKKMPNAHGPHPALGSWKFKPPDVARGFADVSLSD